MTRLCVCAMYCCSKYTTFVDLRSRLVPPRLDLKPLATRLNRMLLLPPQQLPSASTAHEVKVRHAGLWYSNICLCAPEHSSGLVPI